MTDITHSYKPKAMLMVLVTGFFSLCSLLLFHKAQHNDRGLLINHLIPLTTEQATIFFWGLFGASVLAVGGGVLGVIKGLTSQACLRLTDDALILPFGLTGNRVKSVAYGDILDLSVLRIHSQVILNVRHKGGKESIAQSMLPSKAQFEEVVQQLMTRVAAAREDRRRT